jgi:hypothetical protein
MTRLEQDKMIIDKIVEETERKPTGTYNEMMMLHLGAIVGVLADISRSLAILADDVEKE